MTWSRSSPVRTRVCRARSSRPSRRPTKVLVEGVNRVKKHTKVGQSVRGSKTGGIITIEAPVHVSNVMLVVEHEGAKVVTRVGYRRVEEERTLADGSKKTVTRSVRYAKRTGKDI